MQNVGFIGFGYVAQLLLPLLISSSKSKLNYYITTTTADKVNTLKQDFPQLSKVFFLDPTSETEKQKQLDLFLTSIDTLFISVAPKSFNDSYKEVYLKTAELITNVLNQQEKESRKTLQRLIVSSSTGVYGSLTGTVTESTPIEPTTDRQKVLFDTEQTYLKSSVKSVTILRISGIYGPNRDPTERIKKLSGTVVNGSGDATINYVHVDDICHAAIFLLEKDLSGIFNLSDGSPLNRANFYNAVLAKENLEGVTFDPEKEAPHVGFRVVSNQKLLDAGYQVKHPSLLKEFSISNL